MLAAQLRIVGTALGPRQREQQPLSALHRISRLSKPMLATWNQVLS
jgi:hypothetical protein